MKRYGFQPIEKEIGTLYKDALFMRQEIASATGKNGKEYSIDLNLKGSILVTCDGITWLLTPRNLIELAIANGLHDAQEWKEYEEETEAKSL